MPSSNSEPRLVALAGDRVACYLNVDVGTQISHEEDGAHQHAVIYAVGARNGRRTLTSRDPAQ
jgi:hypothetical protein